MTTIMPALCFLVFALHLTLRPNIPNFLQRGYDGAALVVSGLGTAATMYGGWLPPGIDLPWAPFGWMFFYLALAAYGIGMWLEREFDQRLLRLFYHA